MSDNRTKEERFWSFVEMIPHHGCWEWLGGRIKNGYGHFCVMKNGVSKTVKAHRFSYELHIGKIPNGMFVCHSCDNAGCVNPKHLFIGTPQDNMSDKVKKNRQTRHDGGTSKPVKCITNGVTYKSYSAAARDLGLSPSNVASSVTRRHLAGGYLFKGFG